MNTRQVLASLTLVPVLSFASATDTHPIEWFSKPGNDQNMIYQSLNNEPDTKYLAKDNARSRDYPTQVIRMTGNVEAQEQSCEAVNNQIEQFLLKEIPKDKYMYYTVIYCKYDPETSLALEYGIESYFDPISDLAAEHLQRFMQKYNGSDLLGTPLNIETARGVVIAMSIAAGMKKASDTPPFLQYRQDRANFYFKNNYEIRTTLWVDIMNNFFTNSPEKIIPFLNQWVFAQAGSVYEPVLRDSNYVELQPERIFLMEQGELIFVSHLKFYFKHSCEGYENHRCLN